MLPEIETLLILQDRDTKLRRLRQDLQRAPRDEENARSRLASDEAAVVAARDQIVSNDLAMKNLELDIETRRTSINRLRQQQFETRKNEEYRALEHEAERYAAEVSRLEDQQLILMEKGESLKAALGTAQEALARTRALVEEELAQIAERQRQAQTRVAELESERQEIATRIEPGLLFRYERIFEKKAPAVVPLERGICGGCHMKLTPSTTTAVRSEKIVTNCEQCGRILFPGDE